MSSLINNISQNGDMQAMIVSMFNKINNATINSAQSASLKDEKSVSTSDFVKSLEEQLQKSVDTKVLENSNARNSALGIPAGMRVDEENNIIKESYQELLKTIMEKLDENSDGKISSEEMSNLKDQLVQSGNPETTGTLASSNAGDFLKTQASKFIQKLIDKYKDNSESILGIFV